MMSLKPFGLLCLVACVGFAAILSESDPFADRLIHFIHSETPVDILTEEDMQKMLLGLPLHQNENGEPVHNFAHKQTTYCKGTTPPACTDLKTRICDEGKNNIGAHRCTQTGHCSSGRTCSPWGWCQGTSNAVAVDCSATKICAGSWLPPCSSRVSRLCDEGKNSNGSNKCRANEDCILGRTCSFWNWCQGTQTPVVITCPLNTICQGAYMPPCSSRLTRACNEATNSLGANRCKVDADCILGRTCSTWGWCQGTQSLTVSTCSGRRLSDDVFLAPKTESGKHLAQSHLTFCKGAQLPTCTERSSRICSEETNSWGSGRCNGHEDCMSGRNCNTDGFCEGKTDAFEVDCSQ